jgi:hypothetical protein
MNTSPFNTWEEFEASKEAMYAFADSPAIMGILVVISSILFLYWLYTTISLPASKEDEHVG